MRLPRNRKERHRSGVCAVLGGRTIRVSSDICGSKSLIALVLLCDDHTATTPLLVHHWAAGPRQGFWGERRFRTTEDASAYFEVHFSNWDTVKEILRKETGRK